MSAHHSEISPATIEGLYRVTCSCGWATAELGPLESAQEHEAAHLLENRVPNERGDSVIEFGDGTIAVHVGDGIWREMQEIS